MNSRSSHYIITLIVMLGALSGCMGGAHIHETPTADTVGLDADKATNLHFETEKKSTPTTPFMRLPITCNLLPRKPFTRKTTQLISRP